jgi:hypothetical protein
VSVGNAVKAKAKEGGYTVVGDEVVVLVEVVVDVVDFVWKSKIIVEEVR